MKNPASQLETTKSSRSWLPVSLFPAINPQLLIKKMRGSFLWTIDKLKSIVLLNSRKKKNAQDVLHRNAEAVTLQIDDSVTFLFIEGNLKSESKNNKGLINKGRVLTLSNKDECTLSNREETAYLLTMVNKN